MTRTSRPLTWEYRDMCRLIREPVCRGRIDDSSDGFPAANHLAGAR